MSEFDRYPIHGDDPAKGWKHPGEVEIEYVDDGRVEMRRARELPMETAFKKVDGRYRAVVKVKIFGPKGARRLESYDTEGNLLSTVHHSS